VSQFLLAAFTFTRPAHRGDGARPFILTFQRSSNVNAAFAAAVSAGRRFFDRRGRKPLGRTRRRTGATQRRAARPILIII